MCPDSSMAIEERQGSPLSNKRTDHKDETDHRKGEHRPSVERPRDGSRDVPADHLGGDLMLMDPLSYYQAEMFLDPGDRILEELEKPRA